MSDLTYYQGNEDVIQRKDRLRKQARDKCRNLSEGDKSKKREYGRTRYHNMSEEKKQKTKYIL